MALGIDRLNFNMNDKFCESCVLGKQTRLPFPPKSEPRSNRILQLIHSDVCGPISPPAHDGSKYFVTFTDNFSRASTVFCIERKSDVFGKFKEHVAASESLHGCAIAKLRSDNGGEYISDEMKRFCAEKEIQLEYTVPYNPEMNSIAERLNRTLVEKARSMLHASGLDKKFWAEAIYTANYIKNRSPTSAIGDQFVDKTPAEIWFKTKPNLSHLRIFGATCFNHIPVVKRSKLDAKSSKCFMLGYATNGSYRLWDIDSNKLVVGRNVVFNENSILNRYNSGHMLHSEAEINSSNDSDAVDDDDEQSGTSNDHDVNLENIGCSQDTIHGVDSDNIDNSNHHIHGTEPSSAGNSMENDHGANLDGTGDIILRRSTRVRQQPDRYEAATAELQHGFDEGENDAHFALSAMEFVEDEPRTMAEAKRRERELYLL